MIENVSGAVASEKRRMVEVAMMMEKEQSHELVAARSIVCEGSSSEAVMVMV
jgi:hypothetical protein